MVDRTSDKKSLDEVPPLLDISQGRTGYKRSLAEAPPLPDISQGRTGRKCGSRAEPINKEGLVLNTLHKTSSASTKF